MIGRGASKGALLFDRWHMDYEARKEARIQRTRERAEKAAAAAQVEADKAHALSERMWFGQPILVGHHSETRHRRDIAKRDRAISKAVELADKSKALARRADAAEKNSMVSSDDPSAANKLRAKMEELEARRTRMVAANKAIRSKAPKEALVVLGFSEKLVEQLMTPDFAGRLGFPAYALQNASAECARIRKRIEALEAEASRPKAETIHMDGARIEEGDNRVRIVFDDRPSPEMVSRLKSKGFRWAPSVGAWQRQANNAARYAAKSILGATT